MKRTVMLPLEMARQMYKMGGDMRALALQAYKFYELDGILPTTWEEFCERPRTDSGFLIGADGKVDMCDCDGEIMDSANYMETEEEANRVVALMKLLQLRDCYRCGWAPEWNSSTSKYCILHCSNKVYFIDESLNDVHPLAFQTRDVAEFFLSNFIDLIKEAGDLV